MNLITDLLGGNDEAWMATPGRPCASPIDDPAMIRDHADNWYPRENAYTQAKRLCNGCPVGTACLNYALKNREDEGIWGGLTPKERRSILRKNDRDWAAVERAAGVA